jgi:DNA mismatch repair protein, C-terminal domain
MVKGSWSGNEPSIYLRSKEICKIDVDRGSTEKVSHAVGTTVCLTGFLKNIPVRRQTVVKSSSKTITKLKKTLQAYAIARPATRLSFKVLNSKNEKDNWTYAPSSTASITDASRKVAGVEIAGQCVRKSWPEDLDEESDASIKLHAYFLKADAGRSFLSRVLNSFLKVIDFSKIGPSGQYISVDGRPLSSVRGTSKEIIRLYKSHVRSAAKANGIASILEPFLCLHISCPRGSYDANVEPAKDDVLFAERDELIKLSEEFFRGIYGEVEKKPETTGKPPAPVNGFNLLLRQPAAQEPVSPPSTNHLPTVTNISRPTRGTPQVDLENSTPGEDESSDIENGETLSYDNSLNPWSITKTHFFNKSPQSSGATRFVTPTRRGFGRCTPGRHAKVTQSSPSDIPGPYFQLSSPEGTNLSPQRSSSTSVRGRGSRSVPRASRERDRERYGNGSLDAWFMNNNGPTLRIEQVGDVMETESVMLDDFDTDDLDEHSPGTVNRPFRVPLPHERRESSNQSPEKSQGFSVMEEWFSQPHQASSISERSPTAISNSQETERALDFERRKREANIAHRQQLQDRQRYLTTPASSQSTSKSPHKNRYLAAKAVLSQHNQQNQPLHQQKVPFSSSDQVLTDDVSMTESDPRAYLLRHQSELQKESSISQANGVSEKAIKRIPTHRLPLEKIPNGYDIHNLGLILNVPPLQDMAEKCKYLAGIDFYVSGKNTDMEFLSFNPVRNPNLPETCKAWEATIARLINENYCLKDVDLYDAAGGPDDALIEHIDIYAAINEMEST